MSKQHGAVAVIPRQSTTSESSDTSNPKPYTCRYCTLSFARSTALLAHERIHSVGEAKITCDKCSRSFASTVECKTHQADCKGEIAAPTIQPLLKKTRRKKQQASTNAGGKLLSTLAAKKPITYKVPCPECKKMFQTRQKMQRHKWIHRKKSFMCAVCAMSFQLQTELDSHRLSEHAEQKKYLCNDCGKSFASRQGLWEHSRTHDESKALPYTCTECDKTLSSRSGMLIHLRTHSDEKPFTCT